MKRFLLTAAFSLLAVSAVAQTVLSGAPTGAETAIYATGAIVGNGADTTLDTLQTYTLPANTLLNVGDAIHIVASGTFASSTDTKNIKIVFGTPTIASLVGSAAASTAWAFDIWVIKTAANTQSIHAQGTVVGTAGAAGTSSTTTAVVDSSAITIVVQGQNATIATANTANCRIFLVSRRAAPGLT